MIMPRPITKSQFSNNSLVSGKGKPLTVHQKTHFMERHAYRVRLTAMNEKDLGGMAGFIATRAVADWWTYKSHHTHESSRRVRIGGDLDRMSITRGWRRGYKRPGGRSLGVIHQVERGWIVKPLNLPPCLRDANDAVSARNKNKRRKPKREPYR